MQKIFDITEEKLYDLFINKNFRRKEVAEYFGCSDVLIKKKLSKFGIKKPNNLVNKNQKRQTSKKCLICDNKIVGSRYYVTHRKYCSYNCAQIASRKSDEEKRAVANKIAAKRRALTKKAFDKDANQNKIEKIYLKARNLTVETGIKHEVDHIVPISKGGKHHENNLQILTQYDNRSKGNKLDWEK